jgi:tetratricopeptide (TPR) repeat protein
MELRDRLQDTLGAAYTIERELGGGGMSRVFVAEETAFGRKVVVKVLPPDTAGGVNVDRFKREIQVAAKLQHAHIVPVLSSGEMTGVPYYTMPFVEGESLRGRLSRSGALSVAETIGIARDVARALAYAHERGVIHRDIKPDNVMLSGGSAVVTDFGIAKAISAARADAAGGTLTQVGTSLGTPTYMSPEQAAADPAMDHRADLYSFGCMVYEMLAGRPPFVEKTPQKLLAAHMGVAPERVEMMRPDTPAGLAALVMRCLEKDAANRPQSARDVIQSLDSVTSTGDVGAMPPILLGGAGMLKRSLLIYAAAFVAAAVLAKAATVGIGLPDWVFPGTLVVMTLGLPVILFTGYVHRVTHRALTVTPTFTPGGTPSMGFQGTMATIAVKASPHMSWRRTWLGGAVTLGVFIALIGVYMILRALGIGPSASLLAAGKMSTRQPLLVADFTVKGSADTTLGGVVTEAVRANLGQSRTINLVSPASVAAALRRMQRPQTDRIELPLAREIAVRENIKAIVDGDVTAIPAGYVVTLRLVPADTGNDLTSYRVTVGDAKELINAADELARKLRGKIGESLRSVQGSPPLEKVTTASLEALRKYSAGSRANDVEGNFPKAVGLLKEAVVIDTGFAIAWRKLAVALSNATMPRAQSDSAIRRALQYQDRLTSTERLMTLAFYYDNGPGRDRAKAAAAYDELLELGDSSLALNNFALLLGSRREFARAESLYVASMATNPGLALAYTNIIPAQINGGKLREADQSIALARGKFPTIISAAQAAILMLYYRGDVDAFEKALDTTRTSKNPNVRRWGAQRAGDIALVRGRLVDFRRSLAEVSALDSARGADVPAILDSARAVMLDAWLREQQAPAARRLDAALARYPLTQLPQEQRPYLDVATAYALAGAADRARAILAQRSAELKDTALIRDQQPALHDALAQIALAEGRPRDAIPEFRQGDMRPDGPANGCTICLSFNLGRAFDIASEPDSAIAMFERYVKTPMANRLTVANDGLQLAGVYKRLGELYEAKGDRANAITYYRKFVDLWQHADPEFQPKVAEARKKLAALQKAGG